MKNSNGIVKRIVYDVTVNLASPLCVSSGEANATDADVIRDFDGVPFVPGSSLAGAMRDYLKKIGHITDIFGCEDGESRMSMILFSDMHFTNDVIISIRDGVKLDYETKTAISGGKYDMEIIETSQEASFKMELILRKNVEMDVANLEQQVNKILSAIDAGDIRFGANKTRGFGKVKISRVLRGVFTKDNVDEWIAYCGGDSQILTEYKKWLVPIDDIFVTFCYDFSLEGGISIRKYSTVAGEADFAHITCNKKPVIPGTSLNGAIRSQTAIILGELGYPVNRITDVVEEWFGYVNSNKALQSQIIISESVINGGEEVLMTRNKINRFDASTVESALYSEKAHFGGNTEIEIKVRKSARDCDAICGLILLVLKDLSKGYIAVGGQTSVGRGIFAGDVPIEEAEEKRYFRALNEFVREGKKNYA